VALRQAMAVVMVVVVVVEEEEVVEEIGMVGVTGIAADKEGM